MDELVSIIMPARNAAGFIAQSISSILGQSYSEFELIIINDGSSDNTLTIIEQFNDPRICVVEGTATGISDAFNLGLSISQGSYICRCDSDDLYPADRLSTQVYWLNRNPDYVAVCGAYSSIDNKGRHLIQYLRDTPEQNIDNYFANSETLTHFCTFMCRAEPLKQIGGCRNFFVTGEDIDLQLRLSSLGSVYFLAQNLYFYRLHNLSITHTQSNVKREFFEHFARECHRDRLKGLDDKVDLKESISIPEKSDKPRSSDNKIINQLISESWYWHRKKQKRIAINTACKVIKNFPVSGKAWGNLILIIAKS